MLIYIELKYNVKFDTFELESDIKIEKQLEVICECLRAQQGLGADHSKAAVRDIYTVVIYLDPETDSFTIKHDCKNNSLATGILARYVQIKNAEQKSSN